MEQEPGHPQFNKADWPFHGRRSLDELRRMDAELRRLDGPFHFPAGGEFSYSEEGAFGAGSADLYPHPIRGRITGQDAPGSPWYSFREETFYNDSTTYATGSWTFSYAGGFSDSATFNAAELNKNANVPFGSDTLGNDTGAVVILWPLEDGRSFGFFFEEGATSTSSTTYNYNNDTFNYNNSVVNFYNTLFTFLSTTFNVNNLTINYGDASFGGVTFNAWLEICGYQFWCCETYTFGGGNVQDWIPPGPATVYPVTAFAGGTTLKSIVPVGIASVLQATTPGRAASALTATATFPLAVTTGSTIIVKVWGKSTAALTSPTVTDTSGNTYTQDKFVRDASSGVHAGIYRSSNVTGGTVTVTFAYTGTAGVIDLIGEEVSGLAASPVDATGSATATSTAPSPGSVTPGAPYEYVALTMAANDGANPATVTGPANSANFYKELDGAHFTVGSSDYHATSSTATYTPTYALDQSSRWVAAYASYKTKPGPQLVALVNVGAEPLRLADHSAFTAGLGEVFKLPTQYQDVTGVLWQVSLYQQDSILLWYDGCTGDGWEVLSCTASGFGAQKDSGTLYFEPHLAFLSTGNVTFTVTNDSANNRVGVSANGPTGGGGYPTANGVRTLYDAPIAVAIAPGDPDVQAQINGGVGGEVAYDTGSPAYVYNGGGISLYLRIPEDGYYSFKMQCAWSGFEHGKDLAIENELLCNGAQICEAFHQGLPNNSAIFAAGDSQTLAAAADFFCSANDTITLVGGSRGSAGYSVASWDTALVTIHRWG